MNNMHTSDTIDTEIEMDSLHSLSGTELDSDTHQDYTTQDRLLNMVDVLPWADSTDF